MTDTHYELMSTLQDQREKLAEFVQAFEPPEYATLRTMAVDRLDQTQYVIWRGMKPKPLKLGVQLKRLKCIEANTALIEKLNTALVAMPQAVYDAADAGLSEVRK